MRIGIERAETEPDQRVAAVRNLAAYRFEWQGRELFLGTQRIQRVHEVVGGVEQRAIQVEQHGLDGDAVVRFLERAHARTGARPRVRCIR